MGSDCVARLKRIRSRGNLGEKGYQRLKEAIVKGELPTGEILGEAEVTAALGISRTPLREAFNRLKAEGLIEVIPRRGAKVVQITVADIDQLSEVREAVETEFFTRSAKSLPKEELRAMQQALRRAEKNLAAAKHPEELRQAQADYLAADRGFHDRLIEATDNKYWISLYNNIRDRIEMCGFAVKNMPDRFAVAVTEHHEIIEAILNENYPKAKRLLGSHIRSTRESMAEWARENQKEPSK